MSYPIHYVPAGDVLPIFFSTYDGGTGASLTMTGLAVTDIEIYKDGSTTQRASDAGYTLLDTDGIDFDTITGIHGFSIDTGDNTDAGFYTVGAWFHVVVSAVTVDAQTVNFVAAAFRLMPAESIAGKPKVDVDAWLGTAAATPTTAGVPEVDVTFWLGGAVATPTTTGVPEVDVTHWIGTAAATPTTAGVPEVDVTYWLGTAAATPTVAGVPEVDVTYWLGSAATALNTAEDLGLMVETTIATLASQTSFTLTAGSADNDAYNGRLIMIEDASTAAQKCVGEVLDYTGASKTVTLKADPAVFTIATTDKVRIYATPAIGDGTLLTEAGGTGDHLTAIDLPDQTMNITGNITGNLSGSVGSVTGAVGSVTGNVGGNVTGSVGSLAAQAKADVNAEVVDALATDTYAEPTGVPAATTALSTKVGYLYMALRNQIDVTATKKTFYDDGGLAEWEKDLSDDGTTYSESEGNAI